jgi:hypothetical protein
VRSPSGTCASSTRCSANGTWAVLACLAHNLLRWTQLLGLPDTTGRAARTLRRRLIDFPGRRAQPNPRAPRRLTAAFNADQRRLPHPAHRARSLTAAEPPSTAPRTRSRNPKDRSGPRTRHARRSATSHATLTLTKPLIGGFRVNRAIFAAAPRVLSGPVGVTGNFYVFENHARSSGQAGIPGAGAGCDQGHARERTAHLDARQVHQRLARKLDLQNGMRERLRRS